jgi:hypothetical protein
MIIDVVAILPSCWIMILKTLTRLFVYSAKMNPVLVKSPEGQMHEAPLISTNATSLVDGASRTGTSIFRVGLTAE